MDSQKIQSPEPINILDNTKPSGFNIANFAIKHKYYIIGVIVIIIVGFLVYKYYYKPKQETYIENNTLAQPISQHQNQEQFEQEEFEQEDFKQEVDQNQEDFEQDFEQDFDQDAQEGFEEQEYEE